MSDLAYEVYDRADILGATDQGFCKWFALEYAQTIEPKDCFFESIKDKKWDEYLDAVEESSRFLRKGY